MDDVERKKRVADRARKRRAELKLNNPEKYNKILEENRIRLIAWQNVNRDHLRKSSSEYYYANREESLEKRKEWYNNNLEYSKNQTKLNNKKFKLKYPEQYKANSRAKVRKRQADIAKRTPKWADRKKIQAIYNEAVRLTKETGIMHHVDHIIPLHGKLASGLHVHNNLQILTAKDNLSKSNKTEIIWQNLSIQMT